MFVKRKKNRSGTTSIVVAEKTKGIYKELITIGVAKDSKEIDSLVNAGHDWISKEESRRHPQLVLYGEERDACEWDGLKGYLTNTDIPIQDVYTAYHNLWHVERAFRIAKSKIEIRPMFHFTRKRIEAHICICFVALKVYKELERMLKVSEIKRSVDKVLALAKTITTIQIRLPLNKEVYTQTMLMARHQKIAKLFDEDFWVTR